MSQNLLFPVLTLSISVAVVHGSLWIRGIRPSKRVGFWEWISWEVFPKDEQTKEYLKQRFLTTVIVLPVTAAVLYYLL